jgi:hypothetical protein
MPQSRSRNIASIACILRAGETLAEAALQQALKLAAANDAHLSVTIAIQHLTQPYSPIWMSLPAGMVSDINAKSKAKATAAADIARDAARIAAVNIDIQEVMDQGGDATEAAVRAARASETPSARSSRRPVAVIKSTLSIRVTDAAAIVLIATHFSAFFSFHSGARCGACWRGAGGSGRRGTRTTMRCRNVIWLYWTCGSFFGGLSGTGMPSSSIKAGIGRKCAIGPGLC